MNIFKINQWVLLIFFTLPSLFFSEEPVVVSILFFLFFLLYLSFLLNEGNEKAGQVMLRNKIECVFLLLFYSGYFISVLIGREIQLNENLKAIFSIIYFLVFIDLALNLSKLLLNGSNQSASFGRIVVIFFCLLIPPLGIYYLRYLYSKLHTSSSM
jgi:hypothetical protein